MQEEMKLVLTYIGEDAERISPVKGRPNVSKGTTMEKVAEKHERSVFTVWSAIHEGKIPEWLRYRALLHVEYNKRHRGRGN